MSKETIKQQVIEAIEAARPRILALGDELLHTPETAFKETRSAAIMRRELTSLGLPCRDGLALTGLRADLRSGGGRTDRGTPGRTGRAPRARPP